MRENSAIPKVPRVVIVGGGFGGFYAARALAKAPVQVTLVDKRNYHLFRTMLYQVATGLIRATRSLHPCACFQRAEKYRRVDVGSDGRGYRESGCCCPTATCLMTI